MAGDWGVLGEQGADVTSSALAAPSARVSSVRVADAALASEHASQAIDLVVGFAEPVA